MRNKKKFDLNRYNSFILIMIIIFSGIIIRLSYLQVVKGEEFKEKANNRSIREIPDSAPRGNITDVNGKILATNKQGYMLVYNETEENKEVFFQTMSKVFEILEENKEKQQDDFELKINPYRFEFKAQNDEARKLLEIRFKRDRGFNEEIEKKLFKNKKEKLTEEQKKQVDEQLLKITPKETFKKLLKDYDINQSNYSLEDQRKFMIIKDSIKMQSFSGYKPVVIASNINKKTAFIFLQKLNELPGIDITTEPVREYPKGELGSAFLGYISKISWDQEKFEEKGYDVNSDYVGTSGIEGVFEDRLRGSKGGRIVKLNKNGRIIEELGRREPYPGQNIQLTINSDVQAAAEKSLDAVMTELRNSPGRGDVNTSNATRGAAIAIDVNTGGIIAMASKPTFDPNLFAIPGKLSPDLYKKYFNPDLGEFGKQYILSKGLMGSYPGKSLDDVLNIMFPVDKSIKNNTTIREDVYDIYPKPFYNYATMSIIPPGSTFKPMTTIAALESGAITTDFGIYDPGFFDDGKGFKKSFAVGGYGSVGIGKALEVSSNPFFMTLGKVMRDKYGDDILAKYAWKFGLGVKPNSGAVASTGIELPERYGQVFNTWTLQNIFSTQYLWQTMSTLKAGADQRGNSFPSINLYDNENDSEKVKKIKKQIKSEIQECIKNGDKKFSKENYEKLLKSLINSDNLYKDKNITDKDISRIINAIYYVTVSDAYSQLNVGANMYNASIGQGISNFTPLQLVNYVSILVNGGNRYKLHLVDKILDADGNLIKQEKPEILDKINLKPETVEAVKNGMYLVDHGSRGTAASYFSGFPISTGGKTGSATFSNDQAALGRTSYAVYIGFAPYDNPKIAVCVVVFDGGHGGFVAPVARAMYESYFKDELSKMGYSSQYTSNTQEETKKKEESSTQQTSGEEVNTQQVND
jgi:penicillin-binding protein 2